MLVDKQSTSCYLKVNMAFLHLCFVRLNSIFLIFAALFNCLTVNFIQMWITNRLYKRLRRLCCITVIDSSTYRGSNSSCPMPKESCALGLFSCVLFNYFNVFIREHNIDICTLLQQFWITKFYICSGHKDLIGLAHSDF